MRETEIVSGLLALCLLIASGCKSEPAAEPEPEPDPKTEAAPEPRSGKDQAKRSAAEDQADPQRADKLADLDDMCEALDHDYVDGTLTDYYRDVKPRTEWGKAQREAGNAAMQPGRLLEKAVAELSPGAEDPALPNCRKLLDYLDDVE